MSEQRLRVWWIPQIPMNAFHVTVETVEQGRWLLDVLADYDAFQLEHNVKPDYSNMGGIEEWDPSENGWFDVEEDDDESAPSSGLR